MSMNSGVKKGIRIAAFTLLVLAAILLCVVAIFVIYKTEFSKYAILLIGLIVVLAFSVGWIGYSIKVRNRRLSIEAQLEKEQAELKTSIMLSQIQPHFLYNALNAIKVLCQDNPEQAAYAIEEFADYLRMNMSSLQSKKMVPFREELQHTKTYIKIEQLRFQDKLKVIYDTRFEEFSIPPLTMQPLVENAVKHGVGQLDDGGVVTIMTRKEGRKAIISVVDNGKGFDPDAPLSDDRTHVGVQNVKERLKSMKVGTLKIKSVPGGGTEATITIKL